MQLHRLQVSRWLSCRTMFPECVDVDVPLLDWQTRGEGFLLLIGKFEGSRVAGYNTLGEMSG